MSRQKARRDRFIAEGGSQMSVLLAKQPTKAKAKIKKKTGETDEALVSRLLVEEGSRV